MSAMPSPAQSELSESRPAQSEFSEGSLPVRPPAERPALRADDLKNDRFSSGRRSFAKRAPLAFVRFLITFGIGAGATLAWQSYGDAAREMIANSYPQLAWLAPPSAPVAQIAPDQIAPAATSAPTTSAATSAPTTSAALSPDQQLSAVSLDLDAVRQSVDRIATSQEQITRTVDQLAAGQEQMTREIARLHAIEQYILYKNSEAPPRPAPSPAPAPAPRSAPRPPPAPAAR
jgi:hypothetical protein